MEKDFSGWSEVKARINSKPSKAFFHEREVWWCALDINVGHEQDGSSKSYLRPVVIVKRFGSETCLIAPLTTQPKQSLYYFPLGLVRVKNSVANLFQLQSIDRKRLKNKIHVVDEILFYELVSRIIEITFSPIRSLPAISGGE